MIAANAQELEYSCFTPRSKVQRRQSNSRHGDGCNAAMVLFQRIIVKTRSWTIDDTETISTQASNADRVAVVVRLLDEQHVDLLFATDVEHIIEFVDQRVDVDAAEDQVSTARIRVPVDVNIQQRRARWTQWRI